MRVGGGSGGQAAGEHIAAAPRPAGLGHRGGAAQPLVQLVPDQRPGELPLLGGALVGQARLGRGTRGGADRLPTARSTPSPVSAEQVSTGGTQPAPPRMHQPQRAGQFAGGGLGLDLRVLAVGLVDRDHVGDLEHALLDALQLVAGPGQAQEAGRCRPCRRR